MCKCSGCGGYAEYKAFQRRNVALWVEAQQDPNDFSYAEAVAAAQKRDDEARAQWEQEEVGFFVEQRSGRAA